MSSVDKASAYKDTVQPGIPHLGTTPSGWTRAPMSKHLYEERRPVDLQDDVAYDLVTVKRARGGVVRRETKLGRDISVKTQFRVNAGDFLISKRQIVHGACGIVPQELDGSTVSNEYAVLRSHGTIDIDYLKYLSHSVYFQQTCFHSSIGVHIEKMIFSLEKWLTFEFDLPPIAEQRRIAGLLSVWDEAIRAAERLVATSIDQKAALVEGLLTSRVRLPGFGAPWKKVLFDQIAKKCTTAYDPKSNKKQQRCLELEHVEPGTGRLLSETTTAEIDSNKVAFSDKSVLFGKLRPYLRKFALPRFSGVCSSEFWVLDADLNLCQPEYLFYLVQTRAFLRAAAVSSGSKMPRADWEYVKDTTYSLPDKSEQIGIVARINAADEIVLKHQGNFESLRAEKAALLKQLLTGKRRVSDVKAAA